MRAATLRTPRITGIVSAFLAALLASASASAETGEAAKGKPLAFVLAGPAVVPFSVNIHAHGAHPSVWVDLYEDGTKVKRVAGPAAAELEFSITVPAGKHAYELRADDARTDSVNARWTAPAAAKPVVAAAPPAAAKTPPAVAAASPAPTPAAVATSPRASHPPYSFEIGALVYTRFSAMRYSPLAPGLSLAVLRPIDAAVAGAPLSVGVSAGWRHMAGMRTATQYNGRVLPEYAIDVDAFPLEGIGRATKELRGWSMTLQAGAGLELAKSNYQVVGAIPPRRIQNDWAFTASGKVGAARPMAGGTLFLSLGLRSARHSFWAHNFELLHGVESQVAWGKSF